MELINGASIREGEAGDSFAEGYGPSCEFLNVLASDVASGREAFNVVVEVNDAGVYRAAPAHAPPPGRADAAEALHRRPRRALQRKATASSRSSTTATARSPRRCSCSCATT